MLSYGYRFCRFARQEWLYKALYSISTHNHENKTFRKLFLFFLKIFGLASLAMPVVAFTYDNYLYKDSFFSTLFNNVPIFFQQYLVLYQANSVIVTLLSIVIAISTETSFRTKKTLQNEERVSYCFHKTNHWLRNRIEKFIIYLNNLNKTRDHDLDDTEQSHVEFLYKDQCERVCEHMRDVLSEVISDQDAVLSIDIIVEDSTNLGNNRYTLRNFHQWSDEFSHRFTENISIAGDTMIPCKNIYQIVINRVIKIYSEEQSEKRPFGVGFISNDIKGLKVLYPGFSLDNNALKMRKNDTNERLKIRSAIILPIMVDQSIIAFLSFLSTKTGRLRKKHQNMLGGIADQLSILLRKIRNHHSAIHTSRTTLR